MREIKGFAISEIILVVLIIAALAAMVVPRVIGRSEEDKEAGAKSDVGSYLATALKLYEFDNGHFPTTSQGIEALSQKPQTAPVPSNWNGPYIEKRLVDPWGRPYVYLSPGENRMDYDLFSRGKDAEIEEDDITNWR